MREMASGSFDLGITSPPYNLRTNTGSGMGKSSKWKNNALADGYADHSDDMPYDEYVRWQRECLTEMLRIIKNDGAIFYNHKDRVQNGLIQDRSEIVEGFPVRQKIIWQRAGGFNFNDGYFVPTYEQIYLIANPGFKLRKGANGLGDVWKFSQEKNTKHPAPFPLALIEQIIGATDAELILDPFMGSGTTAVAAKNLGRKYVGIELSQQYINIAEERLKDTAQRVRRKRFPSAPSPIARPGGKSRGVDFILPHILATGESELVSPFLGAGSVELVAAASGIKVHGSDADGGLIDFWRYAQECPRALAGKIGQLVPMTAAWFHQLQDTEYPKMKPGLMRAAVWFVLQEFSVNNLAEMGGFAKDKVRRWNDELLDRVRRYTGDNLTFRQQDAFTAIKQSSGKLLYLDPPYYGVDDLYAASVDHTRLFDVLKKRGNWILSYGTDETTVRRYRDFYQQKISWAWGGGKKTAKANELLVFSPDLFSKDGVWMK